MKSQLVGMDEVLGMVKGIKKLPAKCMNRAVRAGAKSPLQKARSKAPRKSGALKSGIVLKNEKTKVKGKKVVQVTFAAAKNNIFVKNTLAGKRYYYPSSQEYGFKTKKGGYKAGIHFMKEALESDPGGVEKTIVETFINEIDKL